LGAGAHFKDHMNNIDIIKISCKIFGLYFLILTVINLREIILYATGTILIPQDNYGTFIIVGGQIYQAMFNSIVGLILIVKSDWITDKLKIQKSGDWKLNLERTDWIELAIIIISLLTIIYSIPEFMYKIVNYVYFNDYEKPDKHLFWTGKNKADVFYSIFKFVVGLFFLLNARNLSKQLTRIGDKVERQVE
jgi:hypothetical protein